ncbi:SPOR domain-containing protein [Nitrincola sp. A-D6]|uniref:SPOR domain-containing protein n=1 Tax=Nitrincola sp. A-D6 TaxID=1545442 RepID=UPI00068B5FBA|nr:SPOR domain-containing protein [Nitrincola sp. A-D6]
MSQPDATVVTEIETIAEVEAVSEVDEPAVEEPAVVEEAPTEEEASVVEEPPVVEEVPVASAPEVAPAPAADPAPAPRPEAPVAASVTSGSQAEMLLDWPDSGFTLQMLGARSEESVVKFIQSQEQPQRFYRFKALFQGAPWHVVVYGQYPTRAAAMEAVRGLPADLRDRNPWARTISSVKEDIKKVDQ